MYMKLYGEIGLLPLSAQLHANSLVTQVIRVSDHNETAKLKPMFGAVKTIHMSLLSSGPRPTFKLLAGLLLGMDRSRGDSNWQYVIGYDGSVVSALSGVMLTSVACVMIGMYNKG